MNAREAKRRRDAEEAAFRQELLVLMNEQKGVIGALARGLTTAQHDIQSLKIQIAGMETERMTVQ